METGEDVLARYVPVDEGYLFLTPVMVQITGGKEIAVLGGQLHIHHVFDARPASGVREHIFGTYHGPILSGNLRQWVGN
jgi:hypothetical protein